MVSSFPGVGVCPRAGQREVLGPHGRNHSTGAQISGPHSRAVGAQAKFLLTGVCTGGWGDRQTPSWGCRATCH